MPKQSSRILHQLARAFGLVGDPDPRRFLLGTAVQPTIDVDRYDPPAQFAAGRRGGPAVAVITGVELAAGPAGARVVGLHSVVNRTVRLMITGVRLPTFAIVGTVPIISALGPAPLSVFSGVNGTAFPASTERLDIYSTPELTPLDLLIPPGRIFTVTPTAVNTAIDVAIYWEEPGQTSGSD